jgi:hypothetical protein
MAAKVTDPARTAVTMRVSTPAGYTEAFGPSPAALAGVQTNKNAPRFT